MEKSEYKSLNKILKKDLSNEAVAALLNASKSLLHIVDGVLSIPVNMEEQPFSEVNTFSFLNKEADTLVSLFKSGV